MHLRASRSPCGSVDRNINPVKFKPMYRVAPLAGAWIEITRLICDSSHTYRRSPCGSVDRNVPPMSPSSCLICRSPCGSVDRNDTTYAETDYVRVAPLAGAWIEIYLFCTLIANILVAPLAGAWIEMYPSAEGSGSTQSLPLRERG